MPNLKEFECGWKKKWYDVNVEIKCSVDNHADSDADGNRGHREVYVDDWSCEVTDQKTKKDVKFESLPQGFQERIEKEIDRRLGDDRWWNEPDDREYGDDL